MSVKDEYQKVYKTLLIQYSVSSVAELGAKKDAFLKDLRETWQTRASNLLSDDKLDLIRKKYEENEEDNDHMANILLLAQNFGTKRDVEVAKALIVLRDVRGHVIKDDNDIAYGIHKRLYPKLKS